MLKIIRAYVCQKFGEVEKISIATGVSVDDLRSFAFGKGTLNGYDLDQLSVYFKLELVAERQPILPREIIESEGLKEDYARDFELVRDTMLFGLKIIGSTPDGPGTLPNIQKPRGLSWPVVWLSLGLYTKIMKQGRAVIALCELGLVKDAGAIERCMFEALLALQYVLKVRKPILADGKPISEVKVQLGTPGPNGQYPPRMLKKVKPLTTQMRAKLYHAYGCIQTEEELNEYIELNRQDLIKEMGDQTIIRQLAKNAKRAIGPAWAERQSFTHHYSGVKIKDLARSYGLEDFYASVYRHQSNTVHGTDGNDFYSNDPLRLDIGPSPGKIQSILFITSAMVMGAVDTLNGRLGLGFKEEVQRRMKELKKRGSEE